MKHYISIAKRIHYFFLLLSLVVTTNALCVQIQTNKESKSMLDDKPYFQLKIAVVNSPYLIEVNGVEIKFDLDGRPFDGSVPINHWIRTGQNKITCMLIQYEEDKRINPEAKCRLELIVHKSGTDIKTAQVISRLDYDSAMDVPGLKGTEASTEDGRYNSAKGFLSDNQNGDVTVSEIKIEPLPMKSMSGKSFTQNVSLTTPFPEWAFYSSDDLEDPLPLNDADYGKYRDELYAVYKKIYDALKTGKIRNILTMFNERNRETDIAFYKKPGETAKRIAEVLIKNTSDPKLELLELSPDYIALERHSNAKLASLQRQNGPAIIFNYTDIEMSISYDLIFRRQNGEWILTR